MQEARLDPRATHVVDLARRRRKLVAKVGMQWVDCCLDMKRRSVDVCVERRGDAAQGANAVACADRSITQGTVPETVDQTAPSPQVSDPVLVEATVPWEQAPWRRLLRTRASQRPARLPLGRIRA